MSGIQHSPYVRDEQPGRKAWCACGESKNQPYCDGTHKSLGKAPIVVELTEAKKVAWCGCRQSKNKPYCDGTHRTLPPK
ncbi:MAG: CDGSH iron-sulfur domain-containing protein [Elusimicrobia bacterium]|nr:CDGSH iron-sulfur domain-containing protein [Elusimicrobiota bacterium]